MTRLLVLRHPETTWNRAARYQGRLEAPLSQEGREQVKLVARAFAGTPLDAVYSSPMIRARQLAFEVAAASGAPLVLDERLTEIGQLPWEGLHLAEIKSRFPVLFEEWHVRPDLVRFPGGESVWNVKDRVMTCVRHIFAAQPGGIVAIVTHSVVVQVLVSLALDLPFRNLHKISVANAGLTVFDGNTAPGSLLSLNSTAHLYGSPLAAALACVS